MHKTYTYSLLKNHCNAVVNTAMYVSKAEMRIAALENWLLNGAPVGSRSPRPLVGVLNTKKTWLQSNII